MLRPLTIKFLRAMIDFILKRLGKGRCSENAAERHRHGLQAVFAGTETVTALELPADM